MVSQCHRKLQCRDKQFLDGSLRKREFSGMSCAGMWLMKSERVKRWVWHERQEYLMTLLWALVPLFSSKIPRKFIRNRSDCAIKYKKYIYLFTWYRNHEKSGRGGLRHLHSSPGVSMSAPPAQESAGCLGSGSWGRAQSPRLLPDAPGRREGLRRVQGEPRQATPFHLLLADLDGAWELSLLRLCSPEARTSSRKLSSR